MKHKLAGAGTAVNRRSPKGFQKKMERQRERHWLTAELKKGELKRQRAELDGSVKVNIYSADYNGPVFIAICKECGDSKFMAWTYGMKMTDVKDPCGVCGGTDWEDRETPAGKKIKKMVEVQE
jgi:predicted nucleic-acid-binding Zn-ribbon protein